MAIDLACFTDIEAAARDAGDALDRSAQPRLYDRIDWLRLTFAHCALPGSPLIVRARSGNSSAWLFLVRNGACATPLASWYTLDFGPISQGPAAPDLLAAIAGELRRQPGLALLDLAPLTAETAAALTTAFGSAGWRPNQSRTSVNWSIAPQPGDWDAYWQGRPSRLRNTVSRRAKRVTTRIETHFDPDAWQAYERVYAESWKPAEGSPDFIRALAELEGKAGTLRLGLGEVDGEIVAAQLWLVEDGVATIHKLAYMQSARPHSPGSVLSAAMFRHAIEQDRVHRIDFGTGDDPYKADWTDTARDLYRLRLWNVRTPRGLVGATRDALSTLAQRLRKS